jgi:hypothetical protein
VERRHQGFEKSIAEQLFLAYEEKRSWYRSYQ